MSASRHYFDCNATAPLRPEAHSAMLSAMDRLGNPSSVHAEGRTARAMVDTARRQVADLAGVNPSSVCFTSGATEANNWALAQGTRSMAAFEDSHDSVLRDVERRKGGILSVLSDGVIDGTEIGRAVEQFNADVISVAAVNNETGVIQPVFDLARECRSLGILLHVDAVQVPGKIDLAGLMDSVNFVSISAHKLGGPPGMGALIMADGSEPEQLIVGGGQENRRRAGTENLVGIAGFGAAAAAVAGNWSDEAGRMGVLRDRLEGDLLDLCPDATIYGRQADRVPNTICIRMPGVPAEIQVMAMDLAGVAISAGSACSSGKVTPSHVLRAMGVSEQHAAEAIRISLGWNTTDADIGACARAWGQLWQRKRAA
jgi:cysteine desulfurase